MNRTKWIVVTVALVLIAVLGAGLMVYPYISAKYTAASQAEVVSEYQAQVENADTTYLNDIRAAAQEYNRRITSGEINPMETMENGYSNHLKVPGSRVMAYIEIPKINVRLPIYHGVGESALRSGAGHMEQSSLPVGGKGTRAVISAHSGMAESPMFTDLEKLEIGDRFAIEVLGETLTYEVYEVEVVLPAAVQHIQIDPERDLVTLITCTPIGVNSHRLLVHGERVTTTTDVGETVETVPDATSAADDTTKSLWSEVYEQSFVTGLVVALCIPIVCGIVLGTILGVSASAKRKKANEK